MIFGGSGSGKTVLLRRIVEEAALIGMPAIVLDINNDLARLADAWPQQPSVWSSEDANKAARYHERIDMMLWTPGMSTGNPLSLALLPDFAALDSSDERDQAIEMGHATLAPYVGASGSSGNLKLGVLADALRGFVQQGGAGLTGLITYLSDLPDGVSQITKAGKHAADMADQLRAAISTKSAPEVRIPVARCQRAFRAGGAGAHAHFRHQLQRACVR